MNTKKWIIICASLALILGLALSAAADPVASLTITKWGFAMGHPNLAEGGTDDSSAMQVNMDVIMGQFQGSPGWDPLTAPAGTAAIPSAGIVGGQFLFFGPFVGYTTADNLNDETNPLRGVYPAPSGTAIAPTINLNLAAWTAGWNGSAFNQGSATVSGTYTPIDASHGTYAVIWTCAIVGGPFNGQTGHWSLSGVATLQVCQCPTCDDGNICNGVETCNDASCPNCIAGTPLNCNDNDPCTTDSCNPTTGCVHTPKNCNDNNACTTDSCNPTTGACVNTPKVCNDNNLCTTDSCDAATGNCVFMPKTCNDNNLCTTDSCDAATGNCVFTPKNCDDGNACTTDSCNASTGACVNTAKNCDDGNPCTADSCDAATGNCVNTPTGLKDVIIRGGGQRPTTTDLEIQTQFTVMNDGCIVDSSASTVTVAPGTVLLFNCKVGLGPLPSSGSWLGVPLAVDSLHVVVCPAATGDVGKLILENKGNGGSDTDRITVKVQ